MKYIIKNCNCYNLDACCATNTDRLYCKDITDCLLKQIVNECREQNLKYDTTACSVLQLLEIEEVRMMSNEVIIDGCNVAECAFYDDLECNSYRQEYWEPQDNTKDLCKEHPDCYFKQLQRAKAENKSLKRRTNRKAADS